MLARTSLFLITLASPALAAPPEIPAFARERPPIHSGEPLWRFNGKDFTGLYTYLQDSKYTDPKGVFSVQDGLLRISGEDFGAITTRESYRDYHLIVEWRWGEATWAPRKDGARDSGLLVHGVGPDGAYDGMWLQSLESQIEEGCSGDFWMVGGLAQPSLTCKTRPGPPNGELYYDPAGIAVTRNSDHFSWWGRDPLWKDEKGFRGARDVDHPTGQWNRQEVLCEGDTITTLVNGLVVNVGTHASQSEGKIQFQSEGAEIFFRLIEIRPLLRPGANAKP